MFNCNHVPHEIAKFAPGLRLLKSDFAEPLAQEWYWKIYSWKFLNQIINQLLPILSVQNFSYFVPQLSVFFDLFNRVHFLELRALFPFLLELVFIKNKIVQIFDDEKGFLLKILFGLKVEFFSFLLIVTWSFNEFIFVFWEVNLLEFMGKLAVLRLHNTNTTQIKATKRSFGLSRLRHVSLNFRLKRWIDNGYLSVSCTYMLRLHG